MEPISAECKSFAGVESALTWAGVSSTAKTAFYLEFGFEEGSSIRGMAIMSEDEYSDATNLIKIPVTDGEPRSL